MGTSKMRVMGLASVMAVALFGFAGLGLAGGPFDPAVKTVVETFFCTSTDSNCTVGTLTVEVSLSKEADPSADPVVTGLTVYLEQHWPRSVNNKGWEQIGNTGMTPNVTVTTPPTPPCCPFGTSSPIGTTVPVTTESSIDYIDLCTLNTTTEGGLVVLAVDPTANAIRAVAVVTVTNAQAKKQNFLGRSVSIPNPCK